MLQDLPGRDLRTDVVRLASRPDVDQFFEDQKLYGPHVQETMAFLHSRGIATSPEDLVDQVFRRKSRLARMKFQTRFSDGSFPVLYGAMDARTATAEVQHWFSKLVGAPAHARTAHYMRFTYRFSGRVKDLRPKHAEWPALTDDEGYGFCNKLGAEALAAGLDGLLAPSARNQGGTNLPAFARAVVGDFSEGELVSITYDPQTGSTTCEIGAASGQGDAVD